MVKILTIIIIIGSCYCVCLNVHVIYTIAWKEFFWQFDVMHNIKCVCIHVLHWFMATKEHIVVSYTSLCFSIPRKPYIKGFYCTGTYIGYFQVK